MQMQGIASSLMTIDCSFQQLSQGNPIKKELIWLQSMDYIDIGSRFENLKTSILWSKNARITLNHTHIHNSESNKPMLVVSDSSINVNFGNFTNTVVKGNSGGILKIDKLCAVNIQYTYFFNIKSHNGPCINAVLRKQEADSAYKKAINLWENIISIFNCTFIGNTAIVVNAVEV